MIWNRNAFGIWSVIAKRAFRTTFKRPQDPSRTLRETLKEKDVAVYIHVPFCTGTCFFCPYTRYPLGKRKLLDKYVQALKSEIKTYGNLLSDLNLRIIDIHVGGGTPSLLEGRHFRGILEALGESFNVNSGLAIEANPEDLADEKVAADLINGGVQEVSLGIQSFNQKTLKNLGRRHDEKDSIKSIENLRCAGVKNINLDMMYLVPNQTLEEWILDLKTATEQDVEEITCYPTLIADHSLAYTLMKEGKIKLGQPSKSYFKQMTHTAKEVLSHEGFKPVEIYGYSRNSDWKYATVNLEMEGPLLGFGCGASGFTGGYEYQNTCFPEEYIRKASINDLTMAGARWVNKQERAIRYTVCELFVCRKLNLSNFRKKFGSFEKLVEESGFGKGLKFMRLMGLIKKRGGTLELSHRGFFQAHMMCWAFVLNVPCRIVEEFMKTAWPEEVQVP